MISVYKDYEYTKFQNYPMNFTWKMKWNKNEGTYQPPASPQFSVFTFLSQVPMRDERYNVISLPEALGLHILIVLSNNYLYIKFQKDRMNFTLKTK